jgi:hypothetical protein
MSDVSSPSPVTNGRASLERRGDSLADVLERVLDKGIVIAGDIRVDLLDIELLTIRIRLLVSSADKAAELGMAWWRNDPFFTGQPVEASPNDDRGDGAPALDDGATAALTRLADNTDELLRRVTALESADGERPAQEEG